MLYMTGAHELNAKDTLSAFTLQHDAVQDVSTTPHAQKTGIYDMKEGRIAVSFYNRLAHFQDWPIYFVALFAGGKTVK